MTNREEKKFIMLRFHFVVRSYITESDKKQSIGTSFK